MPVTCPRCLRTLSTADPNGPPVFCMYCGQKLRDTDTPPTVTAAPTPDVRTTTHVSANLDTDDPKETPPDQIGGYKLLRLLGAGGMGTVFEAASITTGTHVAIKLLSTRLAASHGSLERFKLEGRLASQISHPRCVFVLGADTDAGRPYIVMELMPGRTLRDVVDQDGPLTPQRAITYILDVIDGLAEAHRLGVLHRDIKPSNCFLTSDDRVKVGDFGLSKSLISSGSEQHLTQSGTFLGTVLFAAPEQIRGESLDFEADVYSVCATLYFLLCGEAPYHHTSITAAMARAITEPPPPLRTKRPEISEPLEKVVMRGLERDRSRRWQSLDDLRDALIDLLPDRQSPARPRMMIGAYVLDRIMLNFLTIPAEVLRQLAMSEERIRVELFEVRWAALVVMLAYFTVGDGLFGATPGKWLLGLRVSRVGESGPPGLRAGFVRSLVFAIMILMLVLIPELIGLWIGGATGGFLGGGIMLLGLAALLVQLKRSPGGYRGLHDFASGCHVTQRPLPARKLRLVALRPTPIDVAHDAPHDSLPSHVAGFAIRGRIHSHASGEQIWAGEDNALARKVLLWLRPEHLHTSIPEITRPTRLRRLGTGQVAWAGRNYIWSAYAAPVGVPLVSTILPEHPLPWADARYLLEQLVEELEAAEQEHSTPTSLTLDQVWTEPSGRIQLLDFSINDFAGTQPEDSSALRLLRQVASLTLEGTARADAGPIQAPVPAHATPILDKLFSPKGYATLAELHRDLRETHTHTPEVTAPVRAAQLGIQAAVLAVGLVLMLVASGSLAIVLTKLASDRHRQATAALEVMSDPSRRAELPETPEIIRAFNNELRTRQRLEGLRDRKLSEAESRYANLVQLQKFGLEYLEVGSKAAESTTGSDTKAIQRAIAWASADDQAKEGRGLSPWDPEPAPVFAILVFFPLAWMVGAAVLRGGLSMLLTGIAVVRADGRPALRRQCAIRTLLVWTPFTLLLGLSSWMQVRHYDWPLVSISLWFAAVVLLPVYVVIALRNPTRPPHDRIVGTYLVPI